MDKSQDIWTLANLEEVDFAAVASLLAIKSHGRSIYAPESPKAEDCEDSTDDEGIEEDWQTTRAALDHPPKSPEILKDKFLDRLAELIAREKVDPRAPSRKDSKHVSATAWIEGEEGEPTILLVAKNEGLDERDSKMLQRLQIWLRTIASTGRVPDIQKDHLWVGNSQAEGLLEYNRMRLMNYISVIAQHKAEIEMLVTHAGDLSPSITQLQGACQNINEELTSQHLCDIVDTAYSLRYVSWHATAPRKVLKPILMLGRIRAAYDHLLSTALSFPQFKNVNIQGVTVHHEKTVSQRRFVNCLRESSKLYGFDEHLRSKHARKYTKATRLHIHAEMQILMDIEANTSWQRRAYSYIGISKRPCFLCHELLIKYTRFTMSGPRPPKFRVRNAHNKIYPLWTLPRLRSGLPEAYLSLPNALREVYAGLVRLLSNDPGLQPAIAESSAGVTQSAVSSRTGRNMKQKHLASSRPSAEKTRSRSLDDTVTLGPKITKVLVGRLPMDGGDPNLVPIAFYQHPEKINPRIKEPYLMPIPDFEEYWGSHQFDRRFERIEVKGEGDETLNSQYYIYWNENHELEENRYIKSLIGVKEVEVARRFWYGDVFFVKFVERTRPQWEHDFFDSPLELLRHPFIHHIFTESWNEQHLEEHLDSDRAIRAMDEKRVTDEGILLQRLSPFEQELLKRGPPGMLQFLAMTACDDGAIWPGGIEPSPDDPTKVIIKAWKKTSALDAMQWEGFGSSQL